MASINAGTGRILIYGNSGSGKTTMARALHERHGLAWLSLDDIAWSATGASEAPERRELDECAETLDAFMSKHEVWVMDGCYGDLIELALAACSELRFLNPGIESCVENCQRRPWEPDKYPTREAQDAMLEVLLDWVRAYGERDDDCSLRQHRQLFDAFSGSKREYRALSEYTAGGAGEGVL